MNDTSDKPIPAHVSFRITNPAVAAILSERAEAAGRSPNLVARELFTEALTRTDAVADQLAHVQSGLCDLAAKLTQLDTIQRHLERGIFLLLQHAGRFDAEQAKTALERYFSTGPPAHLGSQNAVHEENGTWERGLLPQPDPVLPGPPPRVSRY